MLSTLQRAGALGVLLVLAAAPAAHAQFITKWLDVGAYHQRYTQSGAIHEGAVSNNGMAWPAILRQSAHLRSQAFWIGVKDWQADTGEQFPYYVARVGPRSPGSEYVFPVEHNVISRFEDPVVEVDGVASFDKVTAIDEIDPSLPAERMIHTTFNTIVGITAEVKVYAFSNEYHDNYHIIESTFTNTGNTDDDEEIELPNQTINDAFFFYIHRYTGNYQGSQVTGGGQQWGKFSMIDVVGDGHDEYAVDFTATYMWPGWRAEQTRFNNLGAPVWDDGPGYIAEGDSVGRLAAATMVGRAIIHADNSATDDTYDPSVQPYTLGFMDQDEPLTADGSSHEEYYEQGIKTRERQSRTPGVPEGRMWPHYADRVEPTGAFDTPTVDASNGKQGGHANTIAYGPYTLAPGESVTIVEVEAIDGLSYDASVEIGRAYKRSAGDDALVIEYDADGDGTITDVGGYDFDGSLFNGDEAMTKNQWVLSARDSLFQTFERAIANWETDLDIPDPPKPPATFTVFGRPDRVDLAWTPFAGESPDHWEIYRTSRYEDNLPYECIAGCPGTPALPGSATSYEDRELVRGTDYFYFIQAVSGGEPVATNEDLLLDGTPGGVPLKSGRYYTQTYSPVNLKRPAFGDAERGWSGTIEDARVVPNPVNLGADQTVRFDREDEIAFFNIPGECTIRIYTELGELVKVIEHTDGSGDEKWNLTTDSRQLLVSGIYVAVITTPDGQRVNRPFAVIR